MTKQSRFFKEEVRLLRRFSPRNDIDWRKKLELKILISPDKFKGCLTAEESARLMAVGVRRALPKTSIRILPVADGGEGTADILYGALGGRRRRTRVHDPLGRPIRAEWTWFPKTRIALLELAQASGLWRLNPLERNPLRTSTYGTGELIKAVLKSKPKTLWIAVGGSATVDGGAGLLQGLGSRLVLKGGRVLNRPARGNDLEEIERIDLSGLAEVPPITVLCDVNNPLLGDRGAARVFGPQKGASPTAVRRLERGLRRWAAVLKKATGKNVLGLSRMGAAGGAAAGIWTVLGGRFVSGADAVLDAVGFDLAAKESDLVLTGEGAVDRTTMEGKAVGRVIERSRRPRAPVIVLAGRVEGNLDRRDGVTFKEISSGLSTKESMKRTQKLLPEAARRAVEEFFISQKGSRLRRRG